MPRKRRQRYTVETTRPSNPRVVILAYNEAGARGVAEQMGLEPVVVTKGDYRMEFKGWKLDPDALFRARRTLGLRWPVDVCTNSREGSTHGNYDLHLGVHAPRRARHLWSEPYYHRIMVKSYLSPEEANDTLWHELIHARQAERCGDQFQWRIWNRAQQRGWNYSDRPMEIEAREGAKKFSGLALTKPL